MKELGFSVFPDDADRGGDVDGSEDDIVGIADATVVRRWELVGLASLVTQWLEGQAGSDDVVIGVRTRLHAWVAFLGCLGAKRRALLVHPAQLHAVSAKGPLVLSESPSGAFSHPNALVLDRVLPGTATRAGRSGVSKIEGDRSVASLWTSGTTGQPQAHTKTAKQLWSEVGALQRELGWNAHDVVVATVPSHHLYGLLFTVLLPLHARAPLVLQRVAEPELFHPGALAEVIRSTGATCLVTVPAHLRMLLDANLELTGLRQVICSAATLDVRWAQQFELRFGAEVVDVWGSTETGGLALRRAAHETTYRPLPDVRVRIDGEGQLWVKSPFAGNDSTDAAEIPSGDRARIVSSGLLIHLGRDDGVVKVGGKRISLQEIESCARQLAGVRDVIARARPVTGLRGTDIWLAVEATGVSPLDIRQYMGEQLDRVFVPRRIRVLERLPLSERGKLEDERFDELFEAMLATQVRGGTWTSASELTIPLVISKRSSRFCGHFPEEAVFPGVAQLTDLVLPAVRAHFEGAQIARWTRLKFTARILPGARLVLSIQCLAPGKWRFEIRQGEVTCSSGVLHAVSAA